MAMRLSRPKLFGQRFCVPWLETLSKPTYRLTSLQFSVGWKLTQLDLHDYRAMDALVARAQADDRDAWNLLVAGTDDYRAELVRSVVKDDQHHDELMAETAEVLVRTVRDYEPGGKQFVQVLRLRIRNAMRQWLAEHSGVLPMPEVAVRHAHEGRKTESALAAKRNAEWIPVEPVDAQDELPDPSGFEGEPSEDEAAFELLDRLQAMEPADRRPLVARWVSEMGYPPEIGERMLALAHDS